MTDYKFFYPNEDVIATQEEFLEFYSKVYFYAFRDLNLEKEIEDILKSNALSEQDIRKILEWKTGGTYNEETSEIPRRGHTSINSASLQELYDILKGPKIQLKTDEDNKKMLTKLLKVNNIGPVYAITLMYFLTNGQLPIYDKYAHIALKIIFENNDFYDDLINDKDLNKEFHKDRTLNDKNIENLYKEYKENYIDRLNAIFGEDSYSKDRRIDQALWVYGHLFNENATNDKRIQKTEK